MWKAFLAGAYLGGVALTFCVVGFFCVLGGKDSDLWKPFVYALTWPVALPLFILGEL